MPLSGWGVYPALSWDGEAGGRAACVRAGSDPPSLPEGRVRRGRGGSSSRNLSLRRGDACVYWGVGYVRNGIILVMLVGDQRSVGDSSVFLSL